MEKKLLRNFFCNILRNISLLGILVWVYFYVYYFVHEIGHFSTAILYYIFQGRFVIPLVKFKWITFFLPYPQQTIGPNNPFIAFSGPIITIIFYFWLSYLLYKKLGTKLTFLPYSFILIYEVWGNILCGTDNWVGRSLTNCDNYPIFEFLTNHLLLLLIISMFLVILMHLYRKYGVCKK